MILEKKYFYQYNLLKENFENYIFIFECIRANYQLINEKVVLGEYLKFHMEYFYNYEKSGKNKYTHKEGIISLRFPQESNILIKYDKKGIQHSKNQIFPNEFELKDWEKPFNIDLILQNNDFNK